MIEGEVPDYAFRITAIFECPREPSAQADLFRHKS